MFRDELKFNNKDDGFGIITKQGKNWVLTKPFESEKYRSNTL